jgi:hypothetical protein
MEKIYLNFLQQIPGGSKAYLGKDTPIKIIDTSQAPVAHICNSSYSGGRDQEDHS